jgi:hypothetical protein
MHQFKNKKILLSPHSPMTLALRQKLESDGVEIIGFIDKNKKDKLDDIQYDYIIILSPNHFNAIYQNYIKYVSKDILYKATIQDNQYTFVNNFIFKQRNISILPCDLNIKRSKIVFISKSFITSNNKALYIYCINHNIECTILTDNIEQIEELKRNNLPFERLDTEQSDLEIAKAKYIIFDQANYTYLPKLHKEQKTIQLWHGVGLKDMALLDNITYDYFISTSHWTNETSFKNTFVAKEFLNCGYPRNDILIQNKENRFDTLFCDINIINDIQNSDTKLILYAPTHRESNPAIPLDFEKLNEQLKSINYTMIIKFHPFVLKYYNNNSTISYSHIKFHNANGDLYPILKYFDILISDYSSIVYDFLLLDKPIIFFNYDIDEYNKNMLFLFDYDEYSPGLKVSTQDELVLAITSNDMYHERREIIKNKFFDSTKQTACKNILDKIFSNNIKDDI